MWIRATNGDCFNLDKFLRLFIQRGAQGSFDNRLHLTLMGEGNNYTDIAAIDLREVEEDVAAQTMLSYLDGITDALAKGVDYHALPQVKED